MLRNLVERQHLLHRACGDGLPRHAEHHAAGLILGHAIGAGIAHLLQSARSVVAHSGHDDAEGILSGCLRDRAEQYVDRRFVAVDERAVADLDVVLGSAAFHHHVFPSRRDQCQAGSYTVPVLALAHFDLAAAVETFRKHGGEALRHVLDDDDAGAGCR